MAHTGHRRMRGSELTLSEGLFRSSAEPALQLWYQSWRPLGEPRAVVVVVHGLKDHASRYTEFAGQLVAKGYAVYAADLRGHGRSGGDRVWVRSFDEYVHDLDQFLALVRAREPGRPLFLVGHSMGGTIATLYAIGHPTGVSGLVISAAALKPDPEVSRATVAFTKLFGLLVPHAKLFRSENARFSRDPAVVAAMNSDPWIHQPPAPVRTAAELLHAMERVRRSAPQLTPPLLALHGSADRLTNPQGSAYLVEHAGSADRRLKVYPGMVHDLLHEPEHAVVTADILDWLARHVAASSGVAPPSARTP